jgi:hypothetical protein
MGRRSRKRSAPPPGERREPAPAAPRTPPPSPRRRARLDEAPQPPWAPFPLVELCILAGLVLLVVGFAKGADGGGRFAVAGLALASIAALELSIREHFAGYRSHTSLLALAVGVGTMLLLGIVLDVARVIAIGVGAVAFAVVWLALRAAFRRRTGGIAFRA